MKTRARTDFETATKIAQIQKSAISSKFLKFQNFKNFRRKSFSLLDNWRPISNVQLTFIYPQILSILPLLGGKKGFETWNPAPWVNRNSQQKKKAELTTFKNVCWLEDSPGARGSSDISK